jgi:hypothetical protein
LRGADLQPCQAAIDAGLSAPPRLLARHAEQVVQVLQTSPKGNKEPFGLDDRMKIRGSDQSLVTATLISPQNTPEPPKSISETIGILFLTFSVYYSVVMLAVYAVRHNRSAMLEWKCVQRVRHVKTINWTAVFWSCFASGVLAPMVILAMGYTSLLREQTSALEMYLEYCRTIKVRIVRYDYCTRSIH